MLKIKVSENHKPSNKVLGLFNSNKLNYTFINRCTQVIERTNIKYLGMCTKNDIDKLNLEKYYVIFYYNELTKKYSQDRKTIKLILNKFQDLNLNLIMIIESNKFIDLFILFCKFLFDLTLECTYFICFFLYIYWFIIFNDMQRIIPYLLFNFFIVKTLVKTHDIYIN